MGRTTAAAAAAIGVWMLACGALPVPGPAPAPPPAPPAPVAAPPPAPVAPAEPAPAASPGVERLGAPPEGFVDLAAHIPGIRLEIRYHTPDNFTGAPIPGYGAPGAWLRRTAADALALVQADLAKKGLGLKVYDAYRPLRATKAMVAWANRTDQVALLDGGYVSRYSGHNRGNTIDLSIVDAASGVELDFGVPWDTLSEASHTRAATGEASENRYLLKGAMEARGFKYYFREWWHFTFVEEGELELPHRDVPYGCFEAPEGAWKPPAGWAEPGWTAPAAFAPTADELARCRPGP